jgi:HEAT repeat protein
MRLLDIWQLSLWLAFASAVVMLLLVLRRVVQTRTARRRARLRGAASQLIFAYIDGSADAEAVRQAAGGHTDIVADLIFEMRQIMRGEGAARLVELAKACGGVDVERRNLRSRNPGTRADALRRITIYGEAAVPALQAALGDRDPMVRTAAAVELTALDAAPPLARLNDHMRIGVDTGSEDLRRIFRRAVAAEPRAAIAMLVDGATSDDVRQLVIDGLGHAGDYQALPIVSAMMQHANPEVRAESLRALANLGHPQSGAVAMAALADPDWRVRAQAANCVRRIGSEQAVPALAPLLDDEQWWVRFRAAEALATLSDAGRDRLASAARHGDRAGQVAQLVLAERGLA